MFMKINWNRSKRPPKKEFGTTPACKKKNVGRLIDFHETRNQMNMCNKTNHAPPPPALPPPTCNTHPIISLINSPYQTANQILFKR